jgi:glutaredoxin
MRRDWIVVSLRMTVLLVLLLGLPGGRAVSAQDSTAGEPDKPVVRFFLFYSPTCPHCHEVMENYLPTVYEKYGTQVEYQYFDIAADSETYITMLRLETKLGVPEDILGHVPTLVIGDKVMVGGAEIPAKLEGYIDEYLAQGGVDFPSLEDLPEVVLPTPAPYLQILVFLDAGQSDFEELSNLMTSLVQAYPDQLQPYGIDVTQEENSSRLAELHTALGVNAAAPGTPEVLIDRRLLVGIEEIRSELPGLIEEYLAQGGSAIPPWEELVGSTPTDTLTPEPESTEAAPSEEPAGSTPTDTVTPEPEGTEVAPRAIYLAYFEQAGCQECARTTYDLKVTQEQYPQLVVESFSMEEAENKALNEWLSEKYGVPEEERLSTPMIFVGDDVLIGTDASLSNLLTVVAGYAQTGAERTWDDFDPEEGEQGIVDRFLSFGMLTVLGAGLIDGLNPCAFATLVFFISYLAFTGRRGRDILFVGISFTLGVFLTYLLVGVGLPADGPALSRSGCPDIPRLFQGTRGPDHRHDPQVALELASPDQQGHPRKCPGARLCGHGLCHRLYRVASGAGLHGSGLSPHHRLRDEPARSGRSGLPLPVALLPDVHPAPGGGLCTELLWYLFRTARPIHQPTYLYHQVYYRPVVRGPGPVDDLDPGSPLWHRQPFELGAYGGSAGRYPHSGGGMAQC